MAFAHGDLTLDVFEKISLLENQKCVRKRFDYLKERMGGVQLQSLTT